HLVRLFSPHGIGGYMKNFNNISGNSRGLDFNGIEVSNLKQRANWIYPLPASDWTRVNQGGARITENDATLSFFAPAQANRLRGMTKALPQSFQFDFRLVFSAITTYNGVLGSYFGAVLASAANEA